MRSLLTALLVACTAPLAGCSHYLLPVSRLETPEVPGPGRLGRAEAAVRLGTDLMSTPSLSHPSAESGDSPEARLSSALVPGADFSIGLAERWEAGVRLQPQAPLEFRGKYQLSGPPESRAARGDFSAAAVAGLGLLLGSQGAASTSYLLVEGALPLGYRLSARDLLLLTPFFSSASLSGAALPTLSPSGVSGQVTGGGGTQLGVGAGYQRTWEALTLRGELSWFQGSLGDSRFGGISAGASLGLNL
jgi:hypothetical protein